MPRPNPLLPASAPTHGTPLKVATSTADLKKGVGSVALAVVAPKAGPINVPVGTPVIVVAKHLWDSPTVKKLLRVAYASWLVFLGYVGVEILRAGSLWKTDWASVARAGADAAVFSGLAGYGISLRRSDNDPTVQ